MTFYRDEDAAELRERRKRAQKAKMKAMGDQSAYLDPYTKYALISQKPMPPALIQAKGRAKSLFRWFSTPPINKLGQIVAAEIVGDYEELQSGFAAVPDVAVDMDYGSWDILLTGGSLDTPGGLDDYTEVKDSGSED